jgi:hypothetical protein
MQATEKITDFPSAATYSISAIWETLKHRKITIQTLASIEPRSLKATSIDLETIKIEADKLFPEHFGQLNCNYILKKASKQRR